MDPNAAHEAALQALAEFRVAQDQENTLDQLTAAEKLADAFEGINDWLTKGGFSPSAWAVLPRHSQPTAARIRDHGRALGQIMDDLKASDHAREREAGDALDDALDNVDSAIRTLEGEDAENDDERACANCERPIVVDHVTDGVPVYVHVATQLGECDASEPFGPGATPIEEEDEDEEHEHIWSLLQQSRLAGTVHRKCIVPGCTVSLAYDEYQAEDQCTDPCCRYADQAHFHDGDDEE